MSQPLHDAGLVDEEDRVGATDGGEAVGDDEGGTSCEEVGERLLTPVELLARLAAVVPLRRYPLVIYHGVLYVMSEQACGGWRRGGADGGGEMSKADWRSVHEELFALDNDSLVTVAGRAAGAVLPVWTAGAPSRVRERPIEAVEAVIAWTRARVVHPEISQLATDAYAAVRSSGLPPGEARRAGLAAAHAAFALYFWSRDEHAKVFAAARNAVSNASNASLDPRFFGDFMRARAAGGPAGRG